MINFLKNLWAFSRPHTIIGSFLSITTLYLLAVYPASVTDLGSKLYWMTLISAFGCNVFIVGLNQLLDIEIDKINKPFLPLASGTMSISQGKIIIGVSLVVCLLLAWLVDTYVLLIMIVIIVIGIAYSAPPLRLKNHHLPASLSIVAVRGIIVNYGIGRFFEQQVSLSYNHVSMLIPLTIFMTAFSLVIAWFKDLYDVKGDKQYGVQTLAATYNKKLAFILGNGIIILSYVVILSLFATTYYSIFLLVAHALSLIAYVIYFYISKIKTQEDIYRFYMRFWVFFFLEYLLFISFALL